jgi:hypothetical protein
VSDLDRLSLITDLSDDDLGLFKNALRVMLTKTFIIRGISNRETELYDFTVRNRPIFDTWFSCMDAGLTIDEGLGVAFFQGAGDTRLRLGREETCALLVMRLLYEEKKLEITLSAFPSVTIADFKHRYNAAVDDEIKKSRLADVLFRLKSLKLVDITTQDVSDEEGIIVLYPSIAVSVHRDSIAALLSSLTGKEKKAAADDDEAPEIDLDPLGAAE